MYAGERRDRIKDIIYVRKNVSVTDLAEILEVSTETIRRDLVVLEEEGFLTKTYGGASLASTFSKSFSPASNSVTLREELRAIAESAVQLIQPNDIVFIDQSTTSQYLVDEIMTMNIKVITNSLTIINRLSDSESITLISTGGKYNSKRNAFIGENACNCIKNFRSDICFLSPGSLSLDKGIYVRSEEEKSIRLSALENSNKVVLLVDHTKFTRFSHVKLMDDYSKIDYLITDYDELNNWKKELGNKIIKVSNKE